MPNPIKSTFTMAIDKATANAQPKGLAVAAAFANATAVDDAISIREC